MLTKAQSRAIEQNTGALLILAGPGTGKTHVIISKIKHLLEHEKVAPEHILALTFSRKATAEMKERVAHFNAELSERLEITTFHAFCTNLVQRHGFRIGLGRRAEMMTMAEARVLFQQVADRLPLQPLIKTSQFEPLMDDLLSLFQECKDEGIWPEDILRYARKLPDDTDDDQKIKDEWNSIGDIYNAFQSFCFELGRIDFGDSLLLATRLLKDHPIVRKEIHKTLKVILVDEFQDTNWTQIQLLRDLASPDAHVAVVGDDDQAIYKFRGASFSAFQFFKELFPNHELVELTETFRLSPSIANVASTLIKANGERRFSADKVLKSLKDPQGAVTILRSNSFEVEANEVTQHISSLLKGGVQPKDIAILVRAHRHADFVIQQAQQMGIPMSSHRATPLFEEALVLDAIALFRVVVNPQESISLLRLFDSPFLRLSADDIFSFCQWAKEKQKSYINILPEVETAPLSAEGKSRLTDFYQFYKEGFAHAARKRPTDLLIEAYAQLTMIDQFLKDNNGDINALTRFHSQLFAWENLQAKKDLRSLLPILESLARSQTDIDEEEAENDPNSIPVLTVHSSKGLEFDHVFILSLSQRRFPSDFRTGSWVLPPEIRKEEAHTKLHHIDEERRLLYVAMTRARKTLWLSAVEKKRTKASLFVTDDIEKAMQGSADIEIRTVNQNLEMAAAAIAPVFARARPALAQASPRAKPLRLSFSQLEKYETCPLAYRFKYVLGIPVAPAPSMATGNVVHLALELFFNDIKQEKDPSKEDLLKFFTDAFDQEKKRFPELPDRDRELALDRLSKYYDFHEGKFHAPHALEQKFSIKIGDHVVSGKIDRVDKTQKGYVIVDYKTGRAKSPENSEDRKFAKDSLQLSVYALAAKENFQWDVAELILYYVYENTWLATTRTDEELEETKTKILEIADQINAQNFSPAPGRHCRWCEYNTICPTAKLD